MEIEETSLFKTLNNYRYGDTTIEQVKNYIQNQEFPTNVNNTTKRNRFTQKWQHFTIENNYLVYNNNDIQLIVVPNSERQSIVKEYYNDFAMSAGAGIKNLYHKICLKYLNITRSYVEKYLKRQGFYNMTRPSNHYIHRPIIDAPFPNMRWGIDTIDMRHFNFAYDKNNKLKKKVNVESTANKGFSYIFTCIDYASRYAWARPLKDQTSTSIVAALKDIMEKSNTVPQIIQSDNGSSFRVDYKRFLAEKGVETIYTKTYSPQSNGLVENLNGQIRKMLRDIMTRKQSINWISYLQKCVQNKNNTRNETTGKTPNQVWTAGLKEAYENEIDEKKAKNIQQARANLITKAKKQIESYKVPIYEKGDLVHIKLSAMYSKIRRVIKEGNKKLLLTSFTPEVYRIHSVLQYKSPYGEDIRPNNAYTVETVTQPPKVLNYRRNDITLPNNKNGRLRFSQNEPMRFYAKDFIKVEENTQPPSYSNKDVLVVNDKYKKLGLLPHKKISKGNEPLVLERGERTRRPNPRFQTGGLILVGGIAHSILDDE